MVIEAKFSSVCPKCNVRIQPRESIEWNRGEAARHISCPTANYSILRDALAAAGDDDDVAYDAYREFVASRPRLQVEDAGVYVLPDGAIVKIQANREKTRVYPKLWVHISGVRLTEADTREHGEYRYIEDPMPRAALRERVEVEGRKMTLDEAKAFILRYGICARCGRGLKAADSVERGIGPVCIKYFSEGTTGAELLGEAPEAPAEDNRQARINEWLAKKGF